MSRCVAARRFVAACLVVLAMSSPALAAGRGDSLEPAGLVDQLIVWLDSLWASAAGILQPPAGTESLDGGCLVDPGGCHGAIVPPVNEEE